jgi:pyrroloquinoline quinone biosynthesis protein D
MHSDKIPTLSSKARLKFDQARQKPVLLYPEGLLFLNQTAYKILLLCDGKRKVDDIVTELSKEYSIERVEMEKDIWYFILTLCERGFIQLN